MWGLIYYQNKLTFCSGTYLATDQILYFSVNIEHFVVSIKCNLLGAHTDARTCVKCLYVYTGTHLWLVITVYSTVTVVFSSEWTLSVSSDPCWCLALSAFSLGPSCNDASLLSSTSSVVDILALYTQT